MVQVALYTQSPTGDPQQLMGPDAYNSFVLDSGSTTILAAAGATDELNASGIFRTDAIYNEQGIAGTTPAGVSAPSYFEYAGSDGVVSPLTSIPSVRILASNLDLDSFGGIAGTPLMVGRNTNLDMTTILTDFAVGVKFSTAPPAGSGHRYSVPLKMVNFPLDGQQHPTDPLPTYAPLATVPVQLRNGTHVVESHFIIDTGGQISFISTAVAAALGINPDTDAIGSIPIGGIGGTVDMPIVAADSLGLHTRQGADLVWTDLEVGVLDIDPQVAGIFGMDFLTSGLLSELSPFINTANLDFRNASSLTGDLLLDLNPAHDMMTSPNNSTSWDSIGSGSFGDSTNWYSQVAPNGAGTTATFGNGVLNTVNAPTVTVTLSGPVVLGSLVFNNTLGTGYILVNGGTSGNAITLDNNGQGATVSVATEVSALQQIQASLVLADNATFDVAAGSSLLITSGGISETGGSRGITLSGGGSLTLGTANGFTGGTTVNSGTLRTTAAGALGSGPLAVNANDGVASVVILGGNETIGGLSGTLAGTGTARVSIAAGKTLTVNQSADSVFAGNISLSSGATAGSGGSLTKSGGAALEIDGAPSLGNNSNINITGGTLRFNLTPSSSGTVAIGSGVTATISNSAVLELAGTVPALSTGGSRVHIVNNGSTPAGMLVSGINQQVGKIDGTGATQVNAGSNLTADHIVQSALVIGGAASSHGVVTIAASDQAGNPLGGSQSDSLGIAGSLTPSGPFGGAASAASGLLLVGAEGFSSDRIPAGQLSGNPNGGGGTSPVPEPGTLVLLALAGIVLVAEFARIQGARALVALGILANSATGGTSNTAEFAAKSLGCRDRCRPGD